MNNEGLPELNLEHPGTGHARNNRAGTLYNMRLQPEVMAQIKVFKKDPFLGALTWGGIFELTISLCCQNGLLMEKTVRKLEKLGFKGPKVSREMRAQFGLGTRWPEVGLAVEQLQQESQRANAILSDVEDALYEFVATVEASELAEETPDPEPAEAVKVTSIPNFRNQSNGGEDQ